MKIFNKFDILYTFLTNLSILKQNHYFLKYFIYVFIYDLKK